MADEEKQLIDEARASREKTRELRDARTRDDEPERKPDGGRDRAESRRAKPSSGNADEVATEE
jgi:hypothetical protein